MIRRLKSICEYAFCAFMVDDTIERIRAALKMPGFTKKSLAKVAGIHRMTLQGCEEPGWNPTAATLRAIEPHLPPIEAAEPAASEAA
jgi:DNA-binding XRE family transcriptional regulator